MHDNVESGLAANFACLLTALHSSSAARWSEVYKLGDKTQKGYMIHSWTTHHHCECMFTTSGIVWQRLHVALYASAC